MRRRNLSFGGRRPLGGIAPRLAFEEQIAEAHRLMEQGHYPEAAALFEQLANIAASRNGPRAPRFFWQAGRAALYARQVARGLTLLERGRAIALQQGRADLVAQVAARLSAEIQSLGMPVAAEQVAAWAGTRLQDAPPNALIEPAAPARLPVEKQRPALPLHCPSCGAPIHPDEVDWLDDHTAECGYCGSPVR